MKVNQRQSGLSIMEEVVVVAAIAILIVFGLPAVRTLFKSMESEGGTKSMISGALSTARAIAAKEQRYAGIRFQNKYQKDGRGCQYMIFIMFDFDKTGLVNGFRAVEGYEPIKLSDSVGVMDLMVRVNHASTDSGAEDPTDRLIAENDLDDTNPANLDTDGRNIYITDTSSFSLIFSPNGRLVTHDVRVRNRKGIYKPSTPTDSGFDDVFNSVENIEINNTGRFIQDDYADLGLGREKSRQSFVLYDYDEFKQLTDRTQRWDYLSGLKPVYINPYIGTIIER